MTRSATWENRIGRRLRLRDLHVFFAVAQSGSMKNAATELRVTQPAVSKAILDLETAVGVRLFDRSTRGVRPTVYGDALMKHGLDAFDALRQGVRQIESLTDPASGEVRVGCPESLSGMVASIIDRLASAHPNIVVHAIPALPALMHLDDLRQRNVDLLLGRVPRMLVENDIDVETLFEEHLLVVTGAQNPWARRRKVSFAALVDEPWILVPKGNLLSSLEVDAFRAHGLVTPRERVTSLSIHMTNHLLATGRFLAMMPSSAFRESSRRWGLKALPIKLGIKPSPVGVLTLKNRTLPPVVHLFIEHARKAAKTTR